MKISFFTPVCKGLESQYARHPRFNLVDDYFKWSGNFCTFEAEQIIKGKKRRVVTLSPRPYGQSTGRKVLKILTYLTLIVPIIMLFAKIISRALHPLIDLSQLSKQAQNGNNSVDLKDDIDCINSTQAHINPKSGSLPRKLNLANLGLKPADLPVPDPSPTTDVRELIRLVRSLNLVLEHNWGIRDLVQVAMRQSDETFILINTYLRAIIDLFKTSDIQLDLKREVLINLGRDAGSVSCAAGRLVKVQKEYDRISGLKFECVREIILRQITDLKLELLIVVAHKIGVHASFHPHFISAAQIVWAERFGLDSNAGARDKDAERCKALVTKMAARKFLELYTPETIIEHVLGRLNANKDSSGAAMHIQKYYKYIKSNLAEEGFGKPESLEELRQHALLGKYVGNVIAELPAGYTDNLDEIYKGVIEEYIKANFIEFADINDIGLDVPLALKEAGLEYILVKMGILTD